MQTLRNSKWTRALAALFAASLAAFALSACEAEPTIENGREIVGEGKKVKVDKLEYKVLFTRPLNRFDIEDKEYLVGQKPPGPEETYLGVFVTIRNTDEDKAHPIPESFEIVDTEGESFENLPSDSPYALNTGTKIPPDDRVPAFNSTAQSGSIQAALLVYLVPDEVLELRPVEFEIPDESGEVVAAVEIDL